ncbi:Single-stranded DNA-binding protein ssb [Caloramator mitchellensis]|uniref:Single-stranded DNA-binding protein n=1 Tax=Caloramator mitchellensis TaxID=908809 RepID=A0A0R3JXP1_CALMK|nr:single-stranded DNA-binding protein [Caloramator mitchellensis]KRQ85966.1 Single-stranded DNA-binding protein ssb [Caloramator mitchellensis]
MNKVILIGRLTRDPEIRYTAGTGIAVTTFTLAVDRPYIGQSGQREADFIPVVCWRKLAELVANNLTKGRLIAVSGSIQTRKYQAQDGTNRYATEVIADEVKFLDRAKEQTGAFKANDEIATDEGDFFPVDGEDDIPF